MHANLDVEAADDLSAGDDLTAGGDANLGDETADTVRVAGRLSSGVAFLTADSTKSSLAVKRGFLEINGAVCYPDTIAAGSDSVVSKVPGVQAGDPVFVSGQDLSGSTAANNVVFAKAYEGEVHARRGGTTNDVVFWVLVLKRGPAPTGF